jgi:succinate-acetate transporter protein
MEITRGNLSGAVVFGSYGPFWVIYGALVSLYATGIPAAQVSSAVALFLAMWAVLSFIFGVASLRTDAVLVLIIWLISIGLVLLAIGAGAKQPGFTQAGGWVTLAFAVLAWYHAAGDIIAATFGRKVLPVWPLNT